MFQHAESSTGFSSKLNYQFIKSDENIIYAELVAFP